MTNETRLIPFKFSDSESGILEVGEGYLKFYKNPTDKLLLCWFCSEISRFAVRDVGLGWVLHVNDARTEYVKLIVLKHCPECGKKL